jgi:hypothetical protein
MSRARGGGVALLAGIALLGASEAHAQARGQQRSESDRTEKVIDPAEVAATRAAKLAELEAWLKRLVGSFRYEGDVAEAIAQFSIGRDVRTQYSRSHAKGMADCIGFGDGPGVQCVIKVTWPPTRAYHPAQGGAGSPSTPGFAEYLILNPAMSLYGIDPDKLGIRYMQVNGKSVAEIGLGTLNGDVLAFETPCKLGELPTTCRQFTRIIAAPDRKSIRIEIDAKLSISLTKISFRFLLHRVPERSSEAASSTGADLQSQGRR